MSDKDFLNKLPPDLRSMIGKTMKRKLPDGRVIKYVLGDVTGDGKIDQEDIEILKLLCRGDATAEKLFASLTPEQLSACDVTGDGYINSDDLIALFKKLINQDKIKEREDKLSNMRNKLKNKND